MPVTVLQSFQAVQGTPANLMEVSFTPAAGSNRRVDVFGFTGSIPALATCTFNGVALTHGGRTTNSINCDVLRLLEADFPTGAGPFLLSYNRQSTGGQGRLFVVVTQDADQTGAPEADVNAGYTASTIAQANITTLTDGALILLAAMDLNGTITDDAGQVRLQTITASDMAACSSKAMATAGATTVGYTISSATGILRALSLAPAGGGGGGISMAGLLSLM